MKEEIGRKNEILSQRIMEMEMSKRKFDEELKKFKEKNVFSLLIKFFL